MGRRIHRVESWAGREGLEIAAETEFAKIKQALLVIKWNEKFTQADAESLTRKCTLLNSLQIHKLLENIRNSQASRAKDSMSREFLGWCIDLARNKVDARLKQNNKQVISPVYFNFFILKDWPILGIIIVGENSGLLPEKFENNVAF